MAFLDGGSFSGFFTGPVMGFANAWKNIFQGKFNNQTWSAIPYAAPFQDWVNNPDHLAAGAIMAGTVLTVGGLAGAYSPAAAAPALGADGTAEGTGVFLGADSAAGALNPGSLSLFAPAGAPGSLTANLPTLAADAGFGTPSVSGVATAPVLGAGGAGVPGAGAGWWSTITAGAKTTGSFLSKTIALVGAAAALKNAIAPAQKGGGGGAGGGDAGGSPRMVPIGAGGGNFGAAPGKAAAAASSLLVPLVFIFAAVGIGYYLVKGKLRHA